MTIDSVSDSDEFNSFDSFKIDNIGQLNGRTVAMLHQNYLMGETDFKAKMK